MTANGWLGYWVLVVGLLVASGAAAWVLGGIAVILLIIGATTALGVTR